MKVPVFVDKVNEGVSSADSDRRSADSNRRSAQPFVCFGLISKRWLPPLFEFIIIYLFTLPACGMHGSRDEAQ